MEVKYCPLAFSNSEGEANLYCEKEKCGFWNERECSVLSIAKSMEKIEKILFFVSKGFIDDGK